MSAVVCTADKPYDQVPMIHSSARRAVALFLAVLVALSLSLSAVQASSMAIEMANMAAMSDAGDSMAGASQKCPNKSDRAAMIAVCGTICVAPATAMLPQDSLTALALAQIDFVKRTSLLRGRAALPEPYPPRSSAIG